MLRDDQLWVWWNRLLISPDPVESANLLPAVAATTPFFEIETPLELGKIGLRLWPGAKIREIEISDQARNFSEFTHQQIELSAQ